MILVSGVKTHRPTQKTLYKGSTVDSDEQDSHGTTSKAEHQVERGLLLDVIVREGASILQLFPSKDKALLVWWDTLLVLDFCLHIIDRIRGLNIQCDCLASECLHEDLHAAAEAE